MTFKQIKDCIPKEFKDSLSEALKLIILNWEALTEENIHKNFQPEKLTKKGVLVLKKIGNLEAPNTKGIFNELKKKLNSFLGKDFIYKIKFF